MLYSLIVNCFSDLLVLCLVNNLKQNWVMRFVILNYYMDGGWWMKGTPFCPRDVCKWECEKCVDDQFNYIFAVGWTAAAVVAGRLHVMNPHMTCEMGFNDLIDFQTEKWIALALFIPIHTPGHCGGDGHFSLSHILSDSERIKLVAFQPFSRILSDFPLITFSFCHKEVKNDVLYGMARV